MDGTLIVARVLVKSFQPKGEWRCGMLMALAERPEYKASLTVRKRVGEEFDWVKTVGIMAKPRSCGLVRMNWQFNLYCRHTTSPGLLSCCYHHHEV